VHRPSFTVHDRVVPVNGQDGLPSLRADDERWIVARRRFGDALLAADGRQADAEAREAYRTCLSVAEVHARVITPAMYWIGELWQRGAITVADEHVATAIAHRVLASLYLTQTDPPLDVRDTVLLAAPSGERHGLGLRIVGDLLELSGFHVVYLGADTPTDALAAAVGEHEPSLVGLSLTMSLGSAKLEEAMEGRQEPYRGYRRAARLCRRRRCRLEDADRYAHGVPARRRNGHCFRPGGDRLRN
jgi:MerR family transcriptional regulator, light-induced transcriptional regulator